MQNNRTDSFEAFKEWLSKKGFSVDTVRAYVSRVRGYQTYLHARGNRLVDDPTEQNEQVLAMEDYLQCCGEVLQMKPHTVNAVATALELYYLFQSGMTYRLIRNSPFPDRANCLSMADLQKLMDCLDSSPKVKSVVCMVLMDGLRISECIALNLTDINMNGADTYIEVHDGHTPARRRIRVNALTAASLAEWLVERRTRVSGADEQALLVNESGHRITRGGLDFLIRAAGHSCRIYVSYRVLHNSRNALSTVTSSTQSLISPA